MLASYQWSLIWEHRIDFLKGLKVALEVSFVAMLLSVVVGILLALARMATGEDLIPPAYAVDRGTGQPTPS